MNSLNPAKVRSADCGFTLVEILVAMVVLAVGLLGMAAMTVLVIRGNRGAGDLTSSTNICQLKMEALKDVSWDDLGNVALASTNIDEQLQKGFQVGGMVGEPENLNAEGKNWQQIEASSSASEADERGPYRFQRTFVVCAGKDYTTSGSDNVPPVGTNAQAFASSIEPPATPDCRVVPGTNSTRVRWLSCDPEDITTAVGAGNREKKIKVLCTWRSSDGQCHSVHLDTTVVQL